MSEIVLEASALLAFASEEMLCERPARLLEAGEYADKALTLTESDLDAIAARFTGGVPVKVEHMDSPLDPLGQVRRVWREGNALLGILAFPDDLAGFLHRRGAAKLSVGLSREPLALLEVSLVLKPRVASAALMTEHHLTAEVVRLRAALSAQEADAQVAAFKAQGRIVPASEAAARALLTAGSGSVLMSGQPEAVSSVFRRFLEAQPPVVLLGEAARGNTNEMDGFTHIEHTFLSKRLGVDPAQVAALVEEERKENSHAH